MKRRGFLHQTGWTLATLGASYFALPLLTPRYHQTLAAPTRRKLALLVGINQYHNTPLSGCLTDVELQQELLISRYGFQPANILTLTDQQATRSTIEQALTEHLSAQAKAGDVVVFHFSGYGSTVLADSTGAVQNSLVPVDVAISDASTAVNDLPEETLGRWVRSLQTDQITLLLDAGYIYPGKPLLGNLRIRARPLLVPAQIREAEQTFKQQNQPPRSIATATTPLPGVWLTATSSDKLATEARWNGFSAGLLTYTLTRYLWHTTPATSLLFCLNRVKEQVESLASQEQHPQLIGSKSQDLPPYFLPPEAPAADGVIRAVEEGGRTAQVWLAGLPVAILERYGVNSLLVLVEASGKVASPPVYLQLLAREGLLAKTKVYRANTNPDITEPPAIAAGQLVRERVRVLPRNIGLTIALDSTLERIERVDAISALTTVPNVSSAIAGEQPADYLFSKVQTVTPTQVATTNLTGITTGKNLAQSSYGLFSPGDNAIPDTAGEAGEAVKVAVRRLIPKLQTLLAGKLLNLTANETSSQVAVRVTLENGDGPSRPLLVRDTAAIAVSPTKLKKITPVDGLLVLSAGNPIQYRIENQAAHPLYILVMGVDSSGSLSILYAPSPSQSVGELPKPLLEYTASLDAKTSVTLPYSTQTGAWNVQGTPGLSETYVICSRVPFVQTQIAIAAARPAGGTAAIYSLQNPLEVIQALLQDLHQASDTAAQVVGNPPDTFILDMDSWASLRFVYQVV